MALFNRKALESYLRTGKYTVPPVSAEDMSLAEHDARWHPDGYKKGDKCLFRANLDKGDKSDADVANATPKQGGISGIFTGSAADYSKPSLMKIGTGEGTQVYGWGLYGSTERGVAEGYADNYDSDEIEYLGERPPPEIAPWAEKNLKAHHGDIDATVQELSTALFPPFKEAAQWLKDNKGSIRYTRKDTPHLYEQTFFTNRAPGDESHLLNWYEPVSEEQLKWINRQAKRENIENLDYLEGFLDRHPGTTAHNIYSRLWDALGSPQAASEFLYRAGIDGIKYPVDSFGGKTIKDGDKTGWNYVSFSDDNIRVDRKWRNGEEVDDAARTKIERYLALDAAPANPDFESKHPRGNSANKGQFRKSEKTLAKLDEADASLSPDGRAGLDRSPSAEYAAVVAKYKNTPQWLRAPNGKPTNLTEKQWVQVRTPSFKKWFGDWENKDSDFSVVMDRDTDEPLVVYHGTRQAGFRAFDNPESPTDSGDGTFWFTDDREAAERFAGSHEDVDFPRQGQTRAVYPAFLNIRRDNVEYEDFHGAHFDGSTGGKFEALAYNDELYENYDGISYFRSEEDLRNSLADEGRDADEYEIRESEDGVGLDTRDFGNQVADDSNPDAALILHNVVDTKLSDGHVSLYGYDRPITEFILKNPKNIKSATSNSGAFSPDKESIMDSVSASPSPDGRTVFDQTSTPKN